MATIDTYTCPAHAEIVSDEPGNCPKCGMKLVPKDSIVRKVFKAFFGIVLGKS